MLVDGKVPLELSFRILDDLKCVLVSGVQVLSGNPRAAVQTDDGLAADDDDEDSPNVGSLFPLRFLRPFGGVEIGEP